MTGVIDVHAHAVLEAGFGQAGRYGPELGADDEGVPYFRVGEYTMKPMGYRGSLFIDVEKRLRLMDRCGIDRQLLSPNPLTFFHGIDAGDALHYCRIHNDAMAELVGEHPDRFLGGIALPMQDVDASIAELQRAVRDLGLAAPYIGTDFGTDPGFDLDDPRLDDFYHALVELDVALFLHPASSGGEGPPPDRRLRRFDLSLLVGYAYEETLAVAALVFGGVLDRHPNLDVCVSHGGGAMPFLIERFELAADTRPWIPESLRDGGFRRSMQRLWFDTHVDGHEAREALVATVGTERLVFGTNFGGWDSAHQEAADPFIQGLSANATQLLRLGASPAISQEAS